MVRRRQETDEVSSSSSRWKFIYGAMILIAVAAASLNTIQGVQDMHHRHERGGILDLGDLVRQSTDHLIAEDATEKDRFDALSTEIDVEEMQRLNDVLFKNKVGEDENSTDLDPMLPDISQGDEEKQDPSIVAGEDGSHDNEKEATPQTEQEGNSNNNIQNDHKPLNVLILYPDDWRHDTIGAAGTQIVRTPNLDALAKRGIRFTHNCVTTSICWVSRGTLFTGQYASRHKALKLRDPYFYNSWNTSWPYLLQSKGDYFVGHVGKWQYRSPWNNMEARDFFNFTHFHEGTHWYAEKRVKYHASDFSAKKTIEFLDVRPADKPFALTVAFYPPKAVGDAPEPGGQYFPKPEHMSLFVNETVPYPIGRENDESWKKLPEFFTERNMARHRHKTRMGNNTQYQASMKYYYRLVYSIDEACSKIIDELEKRGLMDNTMIIFTTDNGFFHGEHGMSGKWYPHEESIRVPLIVYDPRMPKEKIGTLDDSFTLNVDLAETILGAAGITVPDSMQGRDISDLYLKADGKRTWRKEFIYEHLLDQFGKELGPTSMALVRKDFKYFVWPQHGNYEQLFDMNKDPFEQEDVANKPEHTELKIEMKSRLQELKSSIL
mmetsp:Transcript_6149/g.8948  ORF Transcript_6149/g.8948 Transcript_6149/m.8948 type:complete len:605 (+) Transcript_6149:71-1885(+)